ncbi:unnamed protein product, partial [Mesorhabditis spiculigera]
MVLRHQSADSTSSRFSIFSLGRVHSEAASEDADSTSWERSASVSCVRRTRNGSVVSIDKDFECPNADSERKTRLLECLKKEVKNIMEEAVTRKTIDLGSNYVNSLCVAVEACLLDGLRKRMLGLLGQRTSFALLQHVAKAYPPATAVLQRVEENSIDSQCTAQWCWIREALHMHQLSVIVHHITTSTSARRLYENQALMVDRSKAGMVAALLLGPCAVTFKRMSHGNEETSDELVRQASIVQRRNGGRHPLSITRQGSSIVSTSDRASVSRDYIYSLHHNFKSILLYGKNNVSVADASLEEPTKGYLSLHKQTHSGLLLLKWTPNQLMHASSQPCSASRDGEQNYLFKQALTIDISQTIYIHLHQKDEKSPSVLIFVNTEGVQSAPLQFPMGQHSLVFLTTLESGLAPFCRLEPPLWTSQTKEKILPQIRRKTSSAGPTLDYVFRIVYITGPHRVPSEIEPTTPQSPPLNNCISLPNSPNILNGEHMDSMVNFQIGEACETMKQQILARAFFGWLSYVRHLRTIRSHLMYLVEKKQLEDQGCGFVDEAFWDKCRAERTPELEKEFLQRVYWRGIEGDSPKDLRRRCWPYLIGLFAWQEEIEPKTTQFTQVYRDDVEKWRVWEAEVRRLDEEAFNSVRERKVSVREESITSDVFEEEPHASFELKPESSEERLFQLFLTNLHRIEKDVERCDRNLLFFQNKENLESLRRIMCTYVARNLEEGYIQGMCDILAPLLVVFEDEALTLECFTIMMQRMRENFPQRGGMDENLSNLRSLIQVVDPQVFSIFTTSSDFTHLYFSYRWFLLDFKRELSYEGTFRVWETIWASSRTVSPHFQLFFALALVTNYRDVIIENQMDFTDLIKFFNEMAERHDTNRILEGARAHLTALQQLVLHIR